MDDNAKMINKLYGIYEHKEDTIKCYDRTKYRDLKYGNVNCELDREEYQKRYRKNHKNDIDIYNNNYRKNNQYKIKILNKKYNNEKISCICGCNIGKVNILRHLQTEKHFKGLLIH